MEQKLDGTQTEVLVELRRIMDANPRDRYHWLYRAAQARGRDEVMHRPQLKQLRRQFINDHVVRKKYPMNTVCYLHPEWDSGEFLVRHHIVGLKNWGCNRRINIVTLCNRCHKYFHPWLKEEYNKPR